MRHRLTLAILAFSSVLTFECSALLAQTEDAQPILRASDLDIHTCDPLKNSVPGESVADAARRIKAEKNCAEKVKTAVNLLKERMWKKADLDNGFVKVAATAEVSTPSFLIARANVYVRNTSPIRQAYTLTVRCGKWSKTVSGSVDASDASQTGQGFGKPAFSLDVSPPCNVFDSSLELSSPDEVKRKPEETSESAGPGVSDEEMAQRLRSLQGSAKARGPAGNSISDLQRRVDEACKRQPVGELATAPVSSISDHMTACAKAYDDLEAAMKTQGEEQKKEKVEALNQPVPKGSIVIRVTGTEGLPFSGTCSISNRAGTNSKSYDEVVPFQVTVDYVENVNCSFVSKSDFRNALKLEVIKDGKVIGESDTDAPYGVVGVARDVN